MTLPVSFVEVVAVERITPRTARIVFEAEALADTVGTAPDQQLKLCFPRPGQREPVLPAQQDDPMGWYQAYLAIPEAERPVLRSFTLRRRQPGTRRIVVDFVLHGDTGPAASWALRAVPGDRLGLVGPSALYAPPVPLTEAAAAADWVLLAGDETALPAMATLLEALPAGVRAYAWIEVADRAERQELPTRAGLEVEWLYRDGAAPGTLLTGAFRGGVLPGGRPFVWLAGEAGAVRAVRRWLVEERGVPKESIDFTGYWRHRLTQDDAPTAEDLADAQERLAATS
ncbi:siderophore-interacting protein [Streptomyces sp. CBMA123]|uniref:siderophore-interacting protein n=1 Tax=Streptomyces sp. CBMA123 TaxID=1896313 RepID=UPI001661C3B9|nr:siderophore-interacting protein [Streptomyces sp. CBMA123]MBD0691121.1 NADPH-dependent ferric siderophore reductase [Streptomyces sp. CBMA123]